MPRCYHRGVLPYLTAELPGTGGVLRASLEDFVVDEIPAYAPSGAGDHAFVRIEKRGLTTPRRRSIASRMPSRRARATSAARA